MGSQKEINLRDELDLRDRTDIYRNFLHYCMSGNVVSLPMGTTGIVPMNFAELVPIIKVFVMAALSIMVICLARLSPVLALIQLS